MMDGYRELDWSDMEHPSDSEYVRSMLKEQPLTKNEKDLLSKIYQATKEIGYCGE